MTPTSTPRRPVPPARPRAFLWRLLRHRWANAAYDALAVAAGYCNQSPAWPREGFLHWRCARRRWHRGPHQHRYHTWGGAGDEAVPDRSRQQPWRRHAVPTRRQLAELLRTRERVLAELGGEGRD